MAMPLVESVINSVNVFNMLSVAVMFPLISILEYI